MHWMRGRLGAELSKTLLGSSSIAASLFDPKQLAQLVAQAPHTAITSQRAWLLFTLEHWMRRWL